MNVLFKNLPIGITAIELSALIETVFNESGVDNEELHVPASGIEMLEIQDNFTRPIEQFGLVRIFPPEIANIVIGQLNGTVISQHQITVREYFTRSTRNDPRLRRIDDSSGFLEKRALDRRQEGRILKVRSDIDRRDNDRRVGNASVKIERRIKERRKKDRRVKSLIYSRMI